MVSSKRREQLIGLVVILLGSSLYVYGSYQIEVQNRITGLGPAFFPKFVAVSLVVLGGLLLLRTFVGELSGGGVDESPSEGDDASQVGQRAWAGVLVFVITVAYIYAIGPLGYVLASIISMAAIMWILSVRKWYFYLILVVYVLVTQYFFESLMYIQLP